VRLSYLGLILFSLLALGCSRGPESPEEVAEVFFTALSQEDFQTASEFAEPYTAAFLIMAEEMAKVQKSTGEILDLPLGGVVQGPSEERGEFQRVIQVLRGRRVEDIPLVWDGQAWKVRLPESLF